jgi:hypothetical protein
MKRLIGLALLTVLGLSVASCSWMPGTRNNNTGVGTEKVAVFTAREPKAADLVEFQNANARRVQAVQCNKVEMDVRQGTDSPIGISAMLVCEKPRNFRLKGVIVGNPAVDIGSNGDEFWFWTKDPNGGESPLYRCGYTDMASGQARMPIPFNPDMVACMLNIAEYKPNARYEVRQDAKVIELIEPTKSLQGQDVFKVTVFSRDRQRVVAYMLKDKQGKDIYTASIEETQVNKETGAVLPTRVKVVFSGDRSSKPSEMKMTFTDMQVNPVINKERGEALFTRKDLGHLQTIDLARISDKPMGSQEGLQRTGGTER